MFGLIIAAAAALVLLSSNRPAAAAEGIRWDDGTGFTAPPAPVPSENRVGIAGGSGCQQTYYCLATTRWNPDTCRCEPLFGGPVRYIPAEGWGSGMLAPAPPAADPGASWNQPGILGGTTPRYTLPREPVAPFGGGGYFDRGIALPSEPRRAFS